MPTYLFVCGDGHQNEVWRSIHDQTLRETPCEYCGENAVLTLTSPAIAAAALPNKLHGVRAHNARDGRWSKDMDAYKRLRRDGLQPRGIDGSAEWETRANNPLEIEMGKVLGKDKDVRRAQEISSELLQQDVTKTGTEIGKARRGVAA